MTNTLLATADNVADADTLISVDGSSVATFTTGKTVWIIAGKTYTPGGGVVAGSLNILSTGVFSPEANSVTLTDSGTPFTVGGTFNESTSTIIYTGSSATSVTGSTYSNLKVNHAGVTFTVAGSTTVSAVLTIQAGTLDASSQTIILSGSGTPFVNSDTFTASTSTVKYTAGDDTNVASVGYYNLEADLSGIQPYEKAIAVTNGSGGTLTNYQVNIILDADNFNFANSTSDGRDIRIYDTDNSTALSFFIANWNQAGTTASIWVKIPSLTTSGKTIYIGYGDSGLASASSGTDTFVFFDDFANLDNWTTNAGSPSVAGGILTIGSQAEVKKTATDTRPITILSKHKYSALSSTVYWISGLNFARSTDRDYGVRFLNVSDGFYYQTYDGASNHLEITNYADNNYHVFRVSIAAGQSAKGWVDTTYITDLTSNIDDYVDDIYLTNHPFGDSGQTLSVDWVATGQYTATEPTATVGSAVVTNLSLAGNTDVTNNLTVTNGGFVSGANNLTIGGTLSLAADTILTAPAAGQTFSVASDFTNAGTFTHNSGTITLDGQGLQAITCAGTSFNNLLVTNASVAGVSFADSCTVAGTFTDTTASSKVTFHSGSTYAFNALSIDGGAIGTRVVLTSSTGGSAWNFNITEASPTASNVSVKDSTANKDIDATTGGYDATGNTHWLFPVGGNSAPTNDSLTFTNPYSSNVAVSDDTTEWNFQAVVSDTDGSTDLDYVELHLANSADATQPYDSLKFRWTEATDTFSEVADTQSAATLTSTSANSNAVGTQWTINFKFKLNNNFLANDTQYAAELYSIDDSADSDTDNYANIYQATPLSITLSVDSPTLSFGSLIPGNVLTGTTTVSITTNYGNGYSLSVSDAIAGSDSTLLHQGDLSTRVADYSGSIAVPTTWSGTGLGICLYTATDKESKWGGGTTESDLNNKYAGVPENATVMHAKTGSPTNSDANYVGYKLVVPNNQKTGSYSGDITYTATGTLQ